MYKQSCAMLLLQHCLEKVFFFARLAQEEKKFLKYLAKHYSKYLFLMMFYVLA